MSRRARAARCFFFAPSAKSVSLSSTRRHIHHSKSQHLYRPAKKHGALRQSAADGLCVSQGFVYTSALSLSLVSLEPPAPPATKGSRRVWTASEFLARFHRSITEAYSGRTRRCRTVLFRNLIVVYHITRNWPRRRGIEERRGRGRADTRASLPSIRRDIASKRRGRMVWRWVSGEWRDRVRTWRR